MSLLAGLEADLEELQKFLQLAERETTKGLLKNDIERIKILIEKEKLSKPQPIPNNPDAMELEKDVSNLTIVDFLPITKYSFDQEGKIVKIYISLDGIGNLDPSNIKFDVTKDSFDLKIIGYNNSNLRFGIKRLFGHVDPSKCKYTQKTNTLIIRLAKEKDGHWDQLAYKEGAFKPDKMEKDADPQASLMNMMKKLYEEGDPEMKKTIAQAWQKSQDEKDKPFSKEKF